MTLDELGREPHYRRIAVVGMTGSGKTTLARRLAQILAVPHVELDAAHDPDLYRSFTRTAITANLLARHHTWARFGSSRM